MRAPGRSQARKRGERVLRKLLYADSYAIRNDVVHRTVRGRYETRT